MNVLDIAAVLVCLAAVFGLINEHFLKLPNAIGLLGVTLAFSVVVKVLDFAVPSLGIGDTARAMVEGVHFDTTLMQGMLGFLLFAGALHVDFESLKRQRVVVTILATGGVLFCTFAIGTGFWLITGVPFTVALVFGALISPTDPVAVLGILKTAGVPHALETKIAGESLFNDGIGVVVFLVVSAIAFPELAGGHGADGGAGIAALAAEGGSLTVADVAELFVVEAVGGAILGLVASWIVWQLTRKVDDYGLEVLLTLALVMGSYALASHLHMSGPIAVVVAGLLIGHKGLPEGMSEKTREHVTKFWHLADELLNAILFLMLGLELFVIEWANTANVVAGLAAIPLVLLARWIAVSVPLRLLQGSHDFAPGSATVLTWGGLRGGISVALVLSLPASESKPLLLAATYIVVVFSILVQGLTLGRVAKRVLKTA
jgi:CPA1 family monovalent cation:H+ antiporter